MEPIDFGEINYDNVDAQNVEMKDLFEMNADELKYIASISTVSEPKEKYSSKATLIAVAIAFIIFITLLVLAYCTNWGRYIVAGMILIIFFLAGVGIIISELGHTPSKMKKKYPKPFTARVVMNLTYVRSHTHNGHTSHTRVYCPVFITMLNNNYYVFRGHGYTNVYVHTPGKAVTLYMNPENRDYIDYIDPEVNKASGPITFFIGLLFMAFPIIFFFIFMNGSMN